MNWIKCSDEFPKVGQTVICYNGLICTGFYLDEYCPYEKSKKGWWNLKIINELEISDFDFGHYEVTHWMPLPAVPTETDKEPS